MKIYIAGPISGKSGQEVVSYFKMTKAKLIGMGFEVFSPMTGKDEFRNEVAFKSHGYVKNPITTNHAIVGRDMWMVEQADIIYCNLTMAEMVSIGSMMELAWAHLLRKLTIVAMQEHNIHQHAFVLEAAKHIFPTHNDAINYLAKLSPVGRR